MDETRPLDTETVNNHWLILNYPKNPTIRLDARVLDSISSEGRRLVLDINELTVAISVIGGRDPGDIASRLLPFTRSAPITNLEAYEYAKRALDNHEQEAPVETALFLGDEGVLASRTHVRIGAITLDVRHIAMRAEEGKSLPIGRGLIQACLVMIVVADRHRSERDRVLLQQRIAAYRGQ
jgi:hypothetical protein